MRHHHESYNGLFLVALVTLLVGVLVYRNRRYKESSYYQITENSYFSAWYDAGRYGEYLVYKHLRDFGLSGGKFLFNIYLPTASGRTTEIDVLLVCAKGLFVFESKNFSGWIFGNESHQNWTQTFHPDRRGYSHKERFYNPVMQNAAHIKHLKHVLRENLPMYSVIVFSDRCVLKDITVKSKDVHVVTCREVSSVVHSICGQAQADSLSEIEINDIYNRLYPYTQAGPVERQRHNEGAQTSSDVTRQPTEAVQKYWIDP